MLTKEKLRKHLEEFPEEFTIDELVERLILIERIERAEKQSDANDVISDEELDKEIATWFK